jgi:hypothetical protein
MRRRKSKNRLYLRFRTPDGKQSPYCPALFDSKSRIRSFWCLVKGVEEHPEGTYYRRIKRDGRWAWESLGNHPNDALDRLNVRLRTQIQNAALSRGGRGFESRRSRHLFLNSLSSCLGRSLR